MNGISRSTTALFLIFLLNSSFLIVNCNAQTAGKYDFYRYLQQYAVSIDPLGEILGRVSAQFEERLDPNFSRAYEIVYQRDLEDKHTPGWYKESGFTVGALERIRESLTPDGRLIAVEAVSMRNTALHPRSPVARFDTAQGPFNWWLPNLRTLHMFLWAAGYGPATRIGFFRPPAKPEIRAWYCGLSAGPASPAGD